MASLLLQADAAVIAGSLVDGADVLVEHGRVTAAGPRGAVAAPEDALRRTVAGTLLPAPVDLQVNGAGGREVAEATAEALDAVAAAVAAGCAGAFLPTLITAPFDELLERAAAVAAWVGARAAHGDAPGVATPLGLHLEGPFLEVAGAHPAEHFVDPTPERVEALLEACAGRLALVTLAPGRPGAADATRRLSEAGVCVALGHASTTAGFAACVDGGARLVTHLFNAMGPLHHREPGVAGLALDEERLCCSLIPDGVHMHPVMLRNAWRCLGPERTVLVTDAVAAAGMPDGEYRLGGATVQLSHGVVRDAAGRLAGSALSMAEALARFAAAIPGLGPVELARVSATNPARLLGDPQRGSLTAGARAALVQLHPDGRQGRLQRGQGRGQGMYGIRIPDSAGVKAPTSRYQAPPSCGFGPKGALERPRAAD